MDTYLISFSRHYSETFIFGLVDLWFIKSKQKAPAPLTGALNIPDY